MFFFFFLVCFVFFCFFFTVTFFFYHQSEFVSSVQLKCRLMDVTPPVPLCTGPVLSRERKIKWRGTALMVDGGQKSGAGSYAVSRFFHRANITLLQQVSRHHLIKYSSGSANAKRRSCLKRIRFPPLDLWVDIMKQRFPLVMCQISTNIKNPYPHLTLGVQLIFFLFQDTWFKPLSLHVDV